MTSLCVAVDYGGYAVLGTSVSSQSLLKVAKSGTGAGTVTSSPPGINCGSTCSSPLNAGSSVTLTASPAAGSRFSSWSGCDSVSGNQCPLTMNTPRNVTATFKKAGATAPSASITKHKINSHKRKAKFSFHSSGTTSALQCALVRQPKGKKNKKHKPPKPKFSKCKSPKTYKHLKHGRYTFYVRAVGPGGTGTPAKLSFKIS